MAINKTRRPAPAADPVQAANEQVLKMREERILNSIPEPVDLGLDLKDKEPAGNAAEFIDEWDRKAFGDPVATITRVVYGPDPLVDSNPHMRLMLERHGLVDYAAATFDAVMTKGAGAFQDEMLKRGARAAIARFGKEAFANALRERILKIPCRTVEIDSSDTLDPMIMGGNVLRDTVQRYERPGFAYKFLSERCMDTLGMRGYTLVTDPHTGDKVKAGTLYLGEIRQEIADARRERFAAESETEVREIEEAYRESLAREIPRGMRGGIAPLGAGDQITANATETEGWVGETRSAGVRIERQQRVEQRVG